MVHADLHDCDDLDDGDLVGDDVIPQLLQEANSSQDADDVASGISQPSSAGVIGRDMTDNLVALHRLSFKRLPGTPISMFQTDGDSTQGIKKQKHCPYIEINHDTKTFFINKTTAVWLLQEGERVSSDRLFRVRSKQPYATDPQTQLHNVPRTDTGHPTASQVVEVGNICVSGGVSKYVESRESVTIFLFPRENKELSAVPRNHRCHHRQATETHWCSLLLVYSVTTSS